MTCTQYITHCIFFLLLAVATLFLQRSTAVIKEGAGVQVVEVCVGITDVPSGGLQCNLTVFLSTTDEIARMFLSLEE